MARIGSSLSTLAPLSAALTLFAPALAFADPPAAASSPPSEEGIVVEAPEAAVEAPAAEPVAIADEAVAGQPELETSEVAALEAEVAADVQADEFIEPEVYEPDYYEPEPYSEPVRDRAWEEIAPYFSLGIAPGMTLHRGGFHANTRFEFEFGGTMYHDHRNLGLSFGVVGQLTPYYERKRPSGGADVTATALLGPVYIRTGLGAVGGLPRGHLLHRTAAGVGGVAGVGLALGDEAQIRIGADYDFRVTTRREPVHTVFLTFRLVCCRD